MAKDYGNGEGWSVWWTSKYSTVELVIPAKVKNGVTGTTIENKGFYFFTNENNVEKVESKPVTVTPPPVTKINETLDHLDIATGQAYNYNIKDKTSNRYYRLQEICDCRYTWRRFVGYQWNFKRTVIKEQLRPSSM